MNNVKDQIHTDMYSLYNSDCMYVIPTMEDKSIDFELLEQEIERVYLYAVTKRVEIHKIIIELLQAGEYKLGSYYLTFAEMSKHIFRMYQKSLNHFGDYASMFEAYDFWLNMVGYAEKFSQNPNTSSQTFRISYLFCQRPSRP